MQFSPVSCCYSLLAQNIFLNPPVSNILSLCASLSMINHILRVQPTRCDFSQFIYFCKMFCMFQMVFPSITRSSKLHIQHQVFVRPILLPADSSQAVSKPVWHKPLLCVQWKTPDDGPRNCLKHVEFYSKNKFEKLVHLVGFVVRIYHNTRSPERQKCNVVMTSHLIITVCGTLRVPHPLYVTQIWRHKLCLIGQSAHFLWSAIK